MIRIVRHKRRRGLAVVLAVGLGALVPAGPGLAHTTEAAGLQVIHPWTEPGARGATTRAYPTLVNQSESPRALTSVSSELAARVEIVAEGRAVERLELAPDETLGADQFHLRLVELKRDLEAGGHFRAALGFADGRTAEVMMVVGESTQAPDM